MHGARTGKAQVDLARFVGQAYDVRRLPIRARDRHEQVAQQSHSEQRHGRRLDQAQGAQTTRGADTALTRAQTDRQTDRETHGQLERAVMALVRFF